MIKKCDCLRIETNTKNGNIQFHTHFIVVDFDPITNKTIIVNVDTIRYNKSEDYTTILQGGCHRNIPSDSFVNYRFAKIISEDNILKLIKVQKATLLPDPLDEKLIEKIGIGIMKSKFSSPEVKEFYQEIIFNNLF